MPEANALPPHESRRASSPTELSIGWVVLVVAAAGQSLIGQDVALAVSAQTHANERVCSMPSVDDVQLAAAAGRALDATYELCRGFLVGHLRLRCLSSAKLTR